MNKQIESIGIIIDGNRRWAQKNGLKKTDGHKEGLKRVLDTIDWVKEEKIKNTTFYVFSTENWNRKPFEVKALMTLFERVFTKKLDDIKRKEVAVKFIGDLTRFSSNLQNAMHQAEEKTKQHDTKINFAASYGGRAEIINAVQEASKKLSKKEMINLTEEKFENFLWSKDIPDPEIIIRTGGNKRLSNFLLYKSAYSELYFEKTLWPDFSKSLLKEILKNYKEKTQINKGK